MSKVFLIGFMGVGKTTIGKRLANLLNVPFLDTDQLIETSENETIAQSNYAEPRSLQRQADCQEYAFYGFADARIDGIGHD